MNAYGYNVDHVLRHIDQALDGLDEPGRLYVEHIRERFARAAATLDAYPLPAEIRQAVESVFGGAYEGGRISGEDQGERWANKARTRKPSKRLAEIRGLRANRRREQILAVCAEWNKQVNAPGIAEHLAVELGASVTTIYDDIDAIVSASPIPETRPSTAVNQPA